MLNNVQQLLILASICLLGLISTESNYNSMADFDYSVADFDYHYNAGNPYNPALTYAFPGQHAVVYQIVLDVPASIGDLNNITVSYGQHIVNLVIMPTILIEVDIVE